MDTDPGPVTDVERCIVATLTPADVRRFTSAVGEISSTSRPLDAGQSLALAPTPRVEVSAGLAQQRAATAARILGGRYRLGRQLGVGGYGTVFAAEEAFTGEKVAIKVLSPTASLDQQLIIRFHREAIAASRIHHPHIVNVTDFDVDEDDGHYIVMEHLDGRDLAQTLAEIGRLAPERALTIAAQCARGLAAAHRVGVLHRDLKPANVFVVRREGGGEMVKVIDFGISKLTPIAGDYTDVTSASKVVGTPSYMAPEQARGGHLDARTDVYALGVMLFEMLVGERPFTGRSPLEILGNHLSAPRVAPSAFRVELASCPGLDALVLRALSADVEQRFASMEELGDALVACLRAIAPEQAKRATEPTGERTGRTQSTADDGNATSAIARRRPSSHRSRRLAAGAVVIAGVILTIGLLLRAHTSASDQSREPSRPAPRSSAGHPSLPPVAPASAVVIPEPVRPTIAAHEVVITSSPRGATVYRGDGRIGITPLTIVLEPADSTQTLTIGAPGYQRRRVVVGMDRDTVNVVLSPARPRKPAVRSAPISRGVEEW